jgi:hypothetical protein
MHWKVGNWSSRFTKECLAPIIEATQAVHPPDYQTILELDRKIRQFPVPELPDSTHFDRAPMEMRTFSQSRYRELSTCCDAFTNSYRLT